MEGRTRALGPLLACVGAGVDTVGGMVFGFTTGSRARSVCFMKEFMNVDCTIAEAIYDCVRCGYMHEGIGKLTFGWFADYLRVTPGQLLFRRGDGGLVLSVVELALKYVDAVEALWQCDKARLVHLPEENPKTVKRIADVAEMCLPDLEKFREDHRKWVDEVVGSSSAEDIVNGINYWQAD